MQCGSNMVSHLALTVLCVKYKLFPQRIVIASIIRRHPTHCTHAFSLKSILYKYEKHFPKNVEGCRDGSAKNHRN